MIGQRRRCSGRSGSERGRPGSEHGWEAALAPRRTCGARCRWSCERLKQCFTAAEVALPILSQPWSPGAPGGSWGCSWAACQLTCPCGCGALQKPPMDLSWARLCSPPSPGSAASQRLEGLHLKLAGRQPSFCCRFTQAQEPGLKRVAHGRPPPGRVFYEGSIPRAPRVLYAASFRKNSMVCAE